MLTLHLVFVLARLE